MIPDYGSEDLDSGTVGVSFLSRTVALHVSRLYHVDFFAFLVSRIDLLRSCKHSPWSIASLQGGLVRSLPASCS